MFIDTKFLYDKEIYLKLVKTNEEDKEKGYVPSYIFRICLLDGTIVGTCDLRIGYNENTYYGGNIGYMVHERFRGHNYAAKATKLLFELARRHNMEYLYITTTPENIPSIKTCEKVGGIFIEKAKLPEHNEMYLEGRREVLIYKIIL